VLGAVFCGAMALFLSKGTWWRLVFWTVLGFAIYAFYGFKHSRLRKRLPAQPIAKEVT
jgi:APA family basic amino acid/polyamine antiporter